MAKSKKAEATSEENIVFDKMPGGDAKAPQSTESFTVDLDFSDDPKTDDEEVVFPEEQEIEEISQEELKAEDETPSEEPETESAEQEETETVESEESTTEATVETEDEGAVQEDVQPIQEESTGLDKQKAPMVPKSRLDEVLAKQKALQKQLDELNQAKTEAASEAPEYDFASKEAEYQQLVLDGETEKATALRNEIRTAEKEQIMFEVQQSTTQNIQQSTEVQAIQAKAVELEAKYPIFDVNSAEHDADVLKEALELRDAFMAQGYEGPYALERAVNTTLTMHKPELLEVETVKTPDPKVAEINKKQQAAKVTKKIEASQSQPPSMKGEGASSRGDKPVDLTKLSQKEFDALPEETLRRLRGDFGQYSILYTYVR